jgi:hypothetical protein
MIHVDYFVYHWCEFWRKYIVLERNKSQLATNTLTTPETIRNSGLAGASVAWLRPRISLTSRGYDMVQSFNEPHVHPRLSSPDIHFPTL